MKHLGEYIKLCSNNIIHNNITDNNFIEIMRIIEQYHNLHLDNI